MLLCTALGVVYVLQDDGDTVVAYDVSGELRFTQALGLRRHVTGFACTTTASHLFALTDDSGLTAFSLASYWFATPREYADVRGRGLTVARTTAAVISQDGIRLYDTTTWAIAALLAAPPRLRGIALSHDGELLACAVNTARSPDPDELVVVRTTTGVVERTTAVPWTVQSVAPCVGGWLLVTIDHTGLVYRVCDSGSVSQLSVGSIDTAAVCAVDATTLCAVCVDCDTPRLIHSALLRSSST